jgi:hypothetical protein
MTSKVLIIAIELFHSLAPMSVMAPNDFFGLLRHDIVVVLNRYTVWRLNGCSRFRQDGLGDGGCKQLTCVVFGLMVPNDESGTRTEAEPWRCPIQ